MKNDLHNQLIEIAKPHLFDESTTCRSFVERIHKGKLTRDEDESTHFCTFFMPFNPDTHEIFIVHHRKANSWIFPGGHIDRGENLLTTLNREIEEELGAKNQFKRLEEPFIISITEIKNPAQVCDLHYDIWYLFKTDGHNFTVDPQEFYDTQWVTIDRAKELVFDRHTLRAFGKLEELYK